LHDTGILVKDGRAYKLKITLDAFPEETPPGGAD
jgi:hypothetical protein